ncbi:MULTISPECIES: lmo0937 family membrane protein [Psychrobacillus]|uniref:Lmo0937 family membrane protein n=1 Tax=Psychrobacillus faecigallinarum TaxID=2762235 RepID=A0ABR8RE70_9BACI|nr:MULTISPECIES: lmo0937 family membrane protein [Psychrobacillus]MBD7946114.1 lmo0937 family membrane protein [Psychrobacillus faecigallinarum]QEY21885.1 lmo0937 family membrane protein [Psychrobacillus sp. AK 1817]QGM32343.1 lmo0937 family membrane protein [Bacillus sp. N3536]
MGKILWGIVVVLIVLWLLGLLLDFGGGLIHTLLIIAGIIFVIQLVTGRRAV